MQIVLLWSDICIWLLVLAGIAAGWWSRRQPPLVAAWSRVGASRPGMAAATILLAFVLVGLLDSMHYREQLPAKDGEKISYSVEVLSVLDRVLVPLRTRLEKTYSEPMAARAYAKEMVETRLPDGSMRTLRDYPRLKFGGAVLGDDESGLVRDVLIRSARAIVIATIVWLGLCFWVVRRCAGRASVVEQGSEPLSLPEAWRALWRGETGFAWNAVLLALGALMFLAAVLIGLAGEYHVFGTDKVGQDVLYQVLKSVRTALVIGLVTTLVTLPLAVLLGIIAGYFRGWIDDLIQYVYTTLNSIPGVLLIAAAVLMMQVMIDTHPQWFATSAERADLRLLALCFILGLTSWTGLARLLRGEALKLRELEYIQAAQAFGVADLRIITRHLLPNLMHIVIIALVMDFSGLVLAEAVLSYVGIGVDPSMISFGTMINNARMELGREPLVWWSLVAAFSFMFVLVLAANLLADAVRDAFDPRMA
jgi:peptide/nickel transport system permease protein